jgi:hypothetical protein
MLQAARDGYHTGIRPDGSEDKLDPALANPVQALLNYLADPDEDRWCRRAAGLAVGLRAAARQTNPSRADLTAALPALLADERAPLAGGSRELMVLDYSAAPGSRAIAMLDAGSRDLSAWSAITVLDDSDEAVRQPSHRKGWEAWLVWSNLLQLLRGQVPAGRERGFEQTCTSLASAFDPHRLALLVSAAPTASPRTLEPRWVQAIELGSPLVGDLLVLLAQHGRSIPEVGYELDVADEDPWNVELAWKLARVAVVIDDDSERDAAYRAAGWRIERADVVTVADLEELGV